MLKRTGFILLLLTINYCYAQQSEIYSRVKIWATDNRTINEKEISVSHAVYHPEGYYEVDLSGDELEKLKSSGLQYEIIIDNETEFYKNRNQNPVKSDSKNITYNCSSPKTYSTPAHFGTGSMGGFYTYTEVIAQLDTMRALFPDFISAKTQIGTSIDGRAIYTVKISDNPDVNETEKQLLYTSLHHASEPAGMQQLIFFMYYLLENYNADPEIKYLMDNLEIYFVPVVNPDGYVYNEIQNPTGGGTWRKNRRFNDILSYGVDLNRNYGYAWGYDNIGSQPIGLSPWYRGTAAFSEPESQAMKSFIEAHEFLLDMNWHSWGNFLIYPWNYETLLTNDSTMFEEFSRYLSLESHYRYGTCDQTYGYNSNGDADDWGYGEIASKNKIFSFTAEIGSSSDGFWPQISNIESLCKSSLDLNLRFAKLATKYALVTDISQTYISTTQVDIPIEIYCLGMDVPADFTVSITPMSQEILTFGIPASFSAMQTLEKRYDSISFTLNPSIVQGTPISFSLDISNGIFTWNDTITKIFCTPDTVLFDMANTLDNWNSTGWDVSTESFTSIPSCFTESPSSDYNILQTSTLELTNSLDLSTADNAFLVFKAKWEIEKSYDWVQVLASSDDGSTWQPLCGRYSSFGTSDQRAGEPVYDGFFLDWINEEMPLDAYIGGSLKIKFEFHSNVTHNFDGFYLDDIAVLSNKNNSSVGTIQKQNQWVTYPNPADEYLNIVNSVNDNYSIKLTDIFGKIVMLNNGKLSEGNFRLDTHALAAGTYFLQLITLNNVLSTKKIIVIH